MKKTAVFTIIVLALVLLCSCSENFYEYDVTNVSNLGSVSSSTSVDGVTTITIHFDESASSQTVDRQNKKVIQTLDTGRYDTLVKVFEDFGLVANKKYRCSVSVNSSINSINKNGNEFSLNKNDAKVAELNGQAWLGNMAKEFTMTISFGGETIINYANLPISPEGLAPGTLWNDNGTIRIV